MRIFAISLLVSFASAVQAQSSEAFVEQVGGSNVASVTQFASVTRLSQSGTANAARIEQAAGSAATLLQTGSGNTLAGIDRMTGFGALALAAFQIDASTLLLSQIGTDNRAFVQQASGAYASISQIGTGNTVTLIQN